MAFDNKNLGGLSFSITLEEGPGNDFDNPEDIAKRIAQELDDRGFGADLIRDEDLMFYVFDGTESLDDRCAKPIAGEMVGSADLEISGAAHDHNPVLDLARDLLGKPDCRPIIAVCRPDFATYNDSTDTYTLADPNVLVAATVLEVELMPEQPRPDEDELYPAR